MRALLCTLLAGAFALVAAADTNVTGKWSGSFNVIDGGGQVNGSTAVLILNQSGAEITGSVGPNEGEQHAIKKGRIEGEKITLLVEDEGRTINLDLVLVADRMQGEVNMTHNGQTAKAKIEVTRAK
jgi:hypothetical protein